MTTDELLEEAKENVRAIAGGFEGPDEDLEAHMLMVDAEDARALVAIDSVFMSDPTFKDILATSMLPAAIEKFDAIAVAFVSSAWTVSGVKPGELVDHSPVSEHPDRKEAVFISVVTAEESRFSMAYLYRFPDQPPGLGEWTDGSAGFTGRFVDPLRQALKGS